MTTNEKLINELEKVLSGQPWYGSPIYEILDEVTFESAYEQQGGAHTIAEIILHMVSWTEEVIDRLNEKPASAVTGHIQVTRTSKNGKCGLRT